MLRHRAAAAADAVTWEGAAEAEVEECDGFELMPDTCERLSLSLRN